LKSDLSGPPVRAAYRRLVYLTLHQLYKKKGEDLALTNFFSSGAEKYLIVL